MAGGLIQQLDSVSAISGTTTNTLANAPDAGFEVMSFFVEITAITGGTSWQVNILRTFGTHDVTIAQSGTLSVVGSYTIPILIAASGAIDPKQAIPFPSKVNYTKATGTGNLTAIVSVVYGG